MTNVPEVIVSEKVSSRPARWVKDLGLYQSYDGDNIPALQGSGEN